MVKNLPASAGDAGDPGSIPGSERSPGGGNGTPVFLPRESHGQRAGRLQPIGSQKVGHD